MTLRCNTNKLKTLKTSHTKKSFKIGSSITKVRFDRKQIPEM